MRNDVRTLCCGPALLLAVSCGGTGDGGAGDRTSEPVADAYGDGRRVQDLVKPADWYDDSNIDSAGCDTPGPRRTRVTGLTVVAVDEYDESDSGNRTGNVYAVQTPEDGILTPFSGITLRTPTFSPPDYRLFAGDVIDASGNFVEFLGPPAGLFGRCETLPQVEGTVTPRFDGAPIAPYVMVPAVAQAGEDRMANLKSYEAARAFIGMVVTIEDVQLGEVAPSSDGSLGIPINVGGGVLQGDVPRVSDELYDIQGTGPRIADGARFRSITGVWTYFYGFKLAPRSPDDFVAAGS